MSKITTLFVDKGGVVIDDTTLSPRYRRLLREFLPTELRAFDEVNALL